jgi:hypothetical protein
MVFLLSCPPKPTPLRHLLYYDWISNHSLAIYNGEKFVKLNSQVVDVSEFRKKLKENKDKIIKLVETTIPAAVSLLRNPNLDKEIIDTFKRKVDLVINAPEDKIPISAAN